AYSACPTQALPTHLLLTDQGTTSSSRSPAHDRPLIQGSTRHPATPGAEGRKPVPHKVPTANWGCAWRSEHRATHS
ncbi:unnamed protein product, partial [Gulo gulo]